MKRFSLALALGLSLLSLAQVAPSAAAPADSCNFFKHIGYRLELGSRPCVGQRPRLIVRSCSACDHILSGALADDGTLYLEFLSTPACITTDVCWDDSLIIPLDSLSAGLHTITIQAHASVITSLPDTTTCDVRQTDSFTFELVQCPSPDPLPFVTSIQIGTRPDGTVCPGDSIPVSIRAVMPGPCYQFEGFHLVYNPNDPQLPVLEVRVNACPRCFYCPDEPIAYQQTLMLPPQWLGWHTLYAQEVWTGPEPGLFHASYPFEVVDACSTSVPVPFVKVIQVGTPPCASCPPEACPGDSIPVYIAGEFPDNCWEFRGIEMPSDSIGGPRPPTLRVILYRNDCSERPCALVTVPFSQALNLPPLDPGIYALRVEEVHLIDCGPSSAFTREAGFRVVDRCSTGTPPGCLVEDWRHGDAMCDAHVGPDHPAEVEMTVQSTTVPLAGVQGELHFLRIDANPLPTSLRITKLEPVGQVASWKVAWTPTDDGARFLMFSTDGSVISPGFTRVFRPVLKVTVAQVGPGTPPPVSYLAATNLAGSDPHGQQVLPCPTLDRFALSSARICADGRLCDFNRDGVADIRDLVLMVNCIFGYGACPDTATATLDCNGDHQKTLDDLLCCARVVLRGGIPDTTLRRNEPGVQVRFGSPVRTGDRLMVPIQVEGADRLGAGRLVLRFPSDRFDLASVETSASDWLALGEANGSDLVVGLIGLRGPQGTAKMVGPLSLRLYLDLKSGQEAGGDLRLTTGEFSGPDGVALQVPLAPAVVPMDGRPRLVLALPQPNPFSRETRFSVTLPAQNSRLDVTVHDLAGRRVATLSRGGVVSIQSGSLTVPIRWNGTDDAGGRVRDGIYFLHVRAGTEEVTSKIILLRGN